QAVKNGRFGNRLSAPPAGSLTAFSLRPHAKTGDPGTRSPAFPSFRRGSQRRLPALGRYGSKSPALPVPASMPPGRRRVGPTATRQVGDDSRQLQPVTRQQAAVKRRPTAGGWGPCREGGERSGAPRWARRQARNVTGSQSVWLGSAERAVGVCCGVGGVELVSVTQASDGKLRGDVASAFEETRYAGPMEAIRDRPGRNHSVRGCGAYW